MKKVSVHFNSVHDTYLLADCIEKDIPSMQHSPTTLLGRECEGDQQHPMQKWHSVWSCSGVVDRLLAVLVASEYL